MLSVNGLYKSYQKEPVLNGISFQVLPGSILGICGSNGAGKTTLINIIASIFPPDQGSISLMGIPIARASDYRRLIGYVPQNIALSDRLTVSQNLAFWASIQGLKGTGLKQAVEWAAVSANVTGFMNKSLGRCSGGMARRVNLAAGIIGNPQLILLDEPTAGIDEENRDIILQTIRGLREAGRMTLMVNHYENELSAVCDRIITLRNGVIAEAGVHAR
jgi:ABC-2 type transport system ATP-binding protein